MPRFSTRDLLFSMALMALGIWAFAALAIANSWWLGLALPLFCAGAFHLFNRLWLGAGVGGLLAVIYHLVWYIAMWSAWATE